MPCRTSSSYLNNCVFKFNEQRDNLLLFITMLLNFYPFILPPIIFAHFYPLNVNIYLSPCSSFQLNLKKQTMKQPRYNGFLMIHKALRTMLMDMTLELQHANFLNQERTDALLQKLETVIDTFGA